MIHLTEPPLDRLRRGLPIPPDKGPTGDFYGKKKPERLNPDREERKEEEEKETATEEPPSRKLWSL